MPCSQVLGGFLDITSFESSSYHCSQWFLSQCVFLNFIYWCIFFLGGLIAQWNIIEVVDYNVNVDDEILSFEDPSWFDLDKFLFFLWILRHMRRWIKCFLTICVVMKICVLILPPIISTNDGEVVDAITHTMICSFFFDAWMILEKITMVTITWVMPLIIGFDSIF